MEIREREGRKILFLKKIRTNLPYVCIHVSLTLLCDFWGLYSPCLSLISYLFLPFMEYDGLGLGPNGFSLFRNGRYEQMRAQRGHDNSSVEGLFAMSAWMMYGCVRMSQNLLSIIWAIGVGREDWQVRECLLLGQKSDDIDICIGQHTLERGRRSWRPGKP